MGKNYLYWQCKNPKCDFRTPRHPDTKSTEMGFCPRCGSVNWEAKEHDQEIIKA